MERAIEGWENIASMFNAKVRTMLLRRAELQACGAIFYQLKGDPRKHKRHKVVCAFPSKLQEWIMIKSARGERF